MTKTITITMVMITITATITITITMITITVTITMVIITMICSGYNDSLRVWLPAHTEQTASNTMKAFFNFKIQQINEVPFKNQNIIVFSYLSNLG